MNECPKCGARLGIMHEIDGSKDCLRNQLASAMAEVERLTKQNASLKEIVRAWEENEARCVARIDALNAKMMRLFSTTNP